MKFIRYIFLLSGILIYSFSFSQSDNCSSATLLSVTANCSAPVSGTTAGATASIAGCSGNADDDVWYKFVATATSHQITVTASATFDPVVQLFSGTCSTLTTIACQDLGANGTSETIYATGLTIGATYTIRVYHYGAGSGSSTFTICITNPPPAPANNNCSGAISLSVNAACSYTAGTSAGATQSSVGCAGTADDDVWFSFVATNSVQTITVDPSSSMDPVVQLFSGSCASMTSLYCMDVGFTNGNEVINAVGLTPGSTYYIRVYDYYSSTGGAAFDICVTGTATSAPINDEPCSAITLPAVTSACNYLNFTTTGATASTATAPAPASCGGSSPFIGGFSATSHDVWFKIIVPATGNIYITPQPGYGINDAVMALYSGTCGALTQITCSDDYNYPGSANDLKPYLAGTGLTPGATVYLRYWAYGSGSGDFGICVSSPTNDACANALYICDINGYSASTSAAYTPDRPCNMFGDNETNAGVDQPDGTNTGGVFGQGGTWGTGSPFYDVNINNNSWIKFTAAATTASLNVVIGNCWVGNYPSGGIQMQIFSGTNCCSFVPVSNFEENSTGFTITANGLTVGQTYYLMVDGFAGDICNYTITANSGVSFPAITASAPAICYSGTGSNTVTLTGPAGATSYEWSPGGQTTQVITVSPSTTTTYTCIVEGVCGYKQTLTKTITVNPVPSMTSSAAATICSGGTVSIALTASVASTFTWIASNNPNTTGESLVLQSSSTLSNTINNPTSAAEIVTYTVTPTSTGAGCPGSTQTVSVTVNPVPTTSIAGSNQSVCVTTATLSGNTPTVGTGLWTLVSGTGIITSPSSPNSGVTGLGVGANVFQWTISNSPCAPSSTQVTITRSANPTVSAAGSNQSVCSSTATLAGNTPTIGTGLWTLVSGSGTITSPSSPNSGVTGLGVGPNVFQWTISNSPCPPSTSQVTITNAGGPPTTAIAGSNQSVCSTSATLNGNTPSVGTGLWTLVSGSGTVTSPSSPNSGVTGLGTGANVFQWTISNPPCTPSSSQVTITGVAAPTASVAGSNQTLCSTSATLAGNAPTSGTGLWTLVSGSGTITSPSSPNSTVTGLAAGANVFQWTISNAPCSSSSSQVTITNTGGPTTAIAGSNQSVCSTTAILNGNTPSVGTGLWTLISGSGTITSPSSPNSGVTGLGVGPNVFQWTISNPPCTPSSSQVTITGVAAPTSSAAGANQTICSTSATLAGNTPTSGTGLWTLVSGSGTITSPSSPNSTVTGLAAGANVFQWTISNAPCSSSSSQVTITNTGGPTTAIAGSNQSVCSTTATLNGNTPTVGTGLWTLISGSGTITSPSSPNSGVTGLGVGPNVFQWTISNSPCTPSSSQVTITGVAAPTVSAAGSNQTICSTSATLAGNTPVSGTGTWTLISGTGTITSPSSSNSTVTGLGIGANVFEWTISNAPCSSSSSQVTITNTGGPTTAVAGSNQVVCSASATLNGNTPTVGTGLWTLISGSGTITSPSSPNSGVTGLGTGNNVFQWTISNSPCAPSSSQVTITLNNLPSISINPTSSPSNCGQATGSLTGAVVNGTGTLSYSWTDGTNTVVGTSSDLSNQPAGTYNLTVTDGNGCSSVFGPFSIINPGAPTAPTVVANSMSVCAGNPIILTASSTFPNPVFNWTGPNSTGNQPILTIPVATLADSGPYSVSVTSNGCTGVPAIINITVSANPIAAASSTTAIVCSGNTINLNSNGGGTYSWTGPNGFSSSNAIDSVNSSTVSASGTYTVIVTNSSGCKDTANVNILVNQTPFTPLVTTNANSLCVGDSLQLNSNSNLGSTYAWTGPNGFTSSSQNPVIDPVTISNSGNYAVTASLNGCTSTAASVNITVSPNPIAVATSNASSICSGNAINLNASGGGNYSWNGPGGFTSTSSNPVISNSATSDSGTYILTVTNSSNCSDTASVSIVVNQTPQVPAINANAANLCEGQTLLLSSSSTDVLSWSGPNGFTSSNQNPTLLNVTIAETGTYTLYATIGSCNSADTSININVYTVPVAAAFADASSYCSGNAINLSSTGTGNYLWTGPGGFTSSVQNPVISNSLTGNTGTYTVIISNSGNCADTADVTITVNQTPNSPLVTGDTTCIGSPLLLSANGAGTINWYSDASLSNLVQGDSMYYSPVLPINTMGTYYVTSSANGCTSLVSSANAYNYNVIASATADPNSGFTPLNVTFTNLSSGIDNSDSFTWNIDNVTFANTFDASYTFVNDGHYNITLIVMDLTSGCIDTAAVTVFADGEISYTIPNIFTPNDDHVNDEFTIISHGIESINVIIYDRWGLKMYEFNGVHGHWDGYTTSGVRVPDGTYFYLFNAVDVHGKEYKEKGPVMIMR
jgi:gliding motility-associated-like protein